MSASAVSKKILTLLAPILLLSSCFSTGRDFPSRVTWLKKNETKKEDVELVLGRPFSVGSSGGVRTWTYAYYRYQLMGKSHFKELKLYWNAEDNSLQHYSFNTSFPRD